MIRSWHLKKASQYCMSDGSVVKDMNQIRELVGVEEAVPVFAVDDRHTNIRNGTAVPIAPYYVAVNLVEAARIYVDGWSPKHESAYRADFQRSWNLYKLNPGKFSLYAEDTGIMVCIRQLMSFLDPS
jgi:hypothetical protein